MSIKAEPSLVYIKTEPEANDDYCFADVIQFSDELKTEEVKVEPEFLQALDGLDSFEVRPVKHEVIYVKNEPLSNFYDHENEPTTTTVPTYCNICNSKICTVAEKCHNRSAKKFSCNLCPYATPFRKLLERHMKSHTGEKAYSCHLCEYKAIQKIHLADHMRTHTGEKPFVCDLCGFRTSRKTRLVMHKKTPHVGGKPRRRRTRAGAKTGTSSSDCAICNSKICNKKDLTCHNVNPNSFTCNLCPYTTPLRRLLVRHMKSHTGEKAYSCDLCDFKAIQKVHLTDHMRMHTGEKPFLCDFCGFRTSRKNRLTAHKRTHTGEKPDTNPTRLFKPAFRATQSATNAEKCIFSCDACTYASTDKSMLVRHVRIHTGEKPYACNMCDYRASQRPHLKDHMKRHTGEKPFSCDLCDYKASQKTHLRKHMRTHTGEKPFSCTECDFKTAEKRQLTGHMRTHTGEKPFSCNLCPYKTAHKNAIVMHMKQHTTEKPYACNLCNFKVVRKSSLSRHMKTHVQEKSPSDANCND